MVPLRPLCDIASSSQYTTVPDEVRELLESLTHQELFDFE